MKKLKYFLLISFIMVLLVGCGGNKSKNDKSSSKGETGQALELKLGHNLAEDHAVHIALTEFAKNVEEKTDGSVKIKIFPNGTLGSETDMITQIQNGALDMAKVSASTMGNFNDKYNAFSVPYVFDNKEHYYKVMDSDIVKDIYKSTDETGVHGLTWLDSGARSFYTVNKPIRKPEDLKGLKIRTMDSQMAIDMMKALGGSATVMGYSDIYTALQSGVIDGAENNITALRDHGEVAKYYSIDEHTRIPDIVVVSSKVFNVLTEEQKKSMIDSANEMTEKYKKSWEDFENQVMDDVKSKYNVEFINDVDIKAFQDDVVPIYDNLKNNDKELYDIVMQMKDMK